MSAQPITRLAPSPTGALHLGNARTFLINWLLAKQNNWRIILRIEDLDGPRIKPHADAQAIDDLQWLGLDWDDGPFYQSARRPLYSAAVEKLLASRAVYPCICTRKEIDLAASAPHAEDGSALYPGTCRNRFSSLQAAQTHAKRPPALRFRVSDSSVSFTDAFHGLCSFNPATQLGDFVIAKADQTPAYQLAVVVDDAAMNVTHVVRGDDLLDSTPRQMLLYHALGLQERIPTYHHLPLILGPDSRRLAKRHGDTRLSFYRQQGASPQKILALLAHFSHIEIPPALHSPADLLPHFHLSNLPPHPVTFTPAHDAWLRNPAADSQSIKLIS